ncbi:MAG TPA: hypothetical protein DCQ06_09880 [Myxococcales bacterium]|nr:hypothetical protein [Myxococcales bacterium]
MGPIRTSLIRTNPRLWFPSVEGSIVANMNEYSSLISIRWLATLLLTVAFSVSAPAGAKAKSRDIAHWIHRKGDKPLSWLFAEHLKRASKRKQSVVVMFTADWCSPCKAIKEFVAGSAVVRASFTKHRGRLLYIDVDEWRGPAHRLIPGVVPRKLPTLVRIDRSGRKVIETYGSQLGLLSEDAVAMNLGRLFDGKNVKKPVYESDGTKQSELIRAQAQAQQRRSKGVVELQVKPLRGKRGSVRLKIINLDGPRRWYALPLKAGATIASEPKVTSVDLIKYDEHVRAYYLRVNGPTPFFLVPVAGFGDATLTPWPMQGPSKRLRVQELNRVEIDGQVEQFQRKLPYHQHMKKADKIRLIQSRRIKSLKLYPRRTLRPGVKSK